MRNRPYDEDLKQKTYLNDGVYAAHDGYQVWLWVDRENGEHEIAIDAQTMEALLQYWKRITTASEKSDDPV